MGGKALLYGAYGYTGELIAKEAQKKGLEIVLGGRREEPLRNLANQLQFTSTHFGLDNPDIIDKQLSDVELLIHAAGPFTYTANQMMEACIRTGTHYVDITGELDVFERAFELSDRAKDAGVMLMPGTGFDVVPTDCMAVHMKGLMPEAKELTLCFASLPGGISRGTARSAANKLGMPNYTRENGKLVPCKYGHKKSTFTYRGKELVAHSIPWGDLFTAYQSTSIPNISTCMVFGGRMSNAPKLINSFGWLLRKPAVKNWLLKKIDSIAPGPDESILREGKSIVWAECLDASGRKERAAIETSNGYRLTAEATVLISSKILNGNFKTGYKTPAACYGSNLVFELEHSRWL